MNLLNKKIKDKIKLLDDIDKQYIPKIQSKTKKNENQIQNEKSDENNNSFENLKKQKNENFDEIYSNFVLNGHLLGKKFYSNQRNYSISNNNFDKYPTKENSMNNDNEKICEKLNNYGRYVKKIDIQRQTFNKEITNTKFKNEKTKQQKLTQNYKKTITKNNYK